MAKIIGTFDNLWNKGMASDARSLGVRDGDLHTVRSKVKNLLVGSGWATPDGKVEFVTEQDAANALLAARNVIEEASATLSASAKIVVASAGTSPTKQQVLSGSAKATVVSSGTEQVTLTSTNSEVVNAAFHPKMAQAGDRCPRCHGAMEPVSLANERGGIYCRQDRVVLPLPTGTQVRY